mmetsp:Transcript_7207/g.12305  ORF Transcript_7207/g.12305 Transcript_7207/m.12305 type:complete len:204 (-) Transcript_7207:1487-2098(-)
MSTNSRAGDAYAYALLKVLFNETKDFDSFSDLVGDVLDFVTIFNTCPSIEEFFANPTYSPIQKKQFLYDFFGRSLNPILMSFLYLLCDTKRIIYISSIISIFLETLLKNTNSHIVEVQTPTGKDYKLDISKLETTLSGWFNKIQKNNDEAVNFLNFDKSLVIFTVKEVPGLLGGFRLNFVTDSKVIDFSIAGKIKRLAAVLNY